jgi:hypothetical protein
MLLTLLQIITYCSNLRYFAGSLERHHHYDEQDQPFSTLGF